MRAIRASELGTYLYCKRAWWYQLNGEPSQNQAEMTAGTDFHQAHGRQVVTAGFFQILGWLLLLVAVVLLAIWATSSLIG
jgi:CRISPR/Cas system-associated exonuclease Cas4 (RecB family)